MSHEYHKNPAAVGVLNPEQYHVTQETGTERPGAATAGHDSEYERAHQWRDATRELVLTGATAMAAADQPQSQGSISITLTGNALSNDLLLADTGNIVLTSLRDHADARSHPMRVVPMRLDMLSDLPAIRVLGRGVTEPTRLRLVVELIARNPHTDTTSVMTVRIRFRSPRCADAARGTGFPATARRTAPLATTPTHTIRHTGCDTTSPTRSATMARKLHKSTGLNPNAPIVGDRLQAA